VEKKNIKIITAILMIRLEPFATADFQRLIDWIDSEELLMIIAGPMFFFPLTTEQLQKYLDDENSISYNVVELPEVQVIGHAEIILATNHCYKLDKIIIGDKTARGKGFCEQIINELLAVSFLKHAATTVELNVFDFNISAIKCYEKTGFEINPDRKLSLSFYGNTWNAFNMVISKEKWLTKNP
jgi:RimJ/RimL family protein N-acetyltransferase